MPFESDRLAAALDRGGLAVNDPTDPVSALLLVAAELRNAFTHTMLSDHDRAVLYQRALERLAANRNPLGKLLRWRGAHPALAGGAAALLAVATAVIAYGVRNHQHRQDEWSGTIATGKLPSVS